MNASQKIVLAVFIGVPVIEIFLLIEVGSIIGVIPTILLVILTAVLGANLMRQQGFATWQRLQSNLAQGVMPANDLVEGMLLLFGGMLLLTPGFFTDACGFALMQPTLRHKAAHYVVEHRLFSIIRPGGAASQPQKQADVLEGEFRREDER